MSKGHVIIPRSERQYDHNGDSETISGWKCKRCGHSWWGRHKPFSTTQPECDQVIVQRVMES